MLRAKPKRLRSPKLHELRGSAIGSVGSRRIGEDWSMRSSPHKLLLKNQAIYVFHAVDTLFYKIGIAIDIEARRRELQCGIPFNLELVCFFHPEGNARRIESAIHAKAREQKRYSPADNEYFRFESDEDVINFLKLFLPEVPEGLGTGLLIRS